MRKPRTYGGAAMKTLTRLSAAALLVAPLAFGAVSPQEAARLGAELTPLGGEKAGNADGTIPAWDGGLKSAADAGFPNYHSPDHYADPYAGDKPLFTITAANVAQYAAKLTEGHKALFKAYPDYKMIVYPTHRSGASPQSVYDATKRNATTAKLVPDGNGFSGALGGTPFPIPQNGLEVYWNHVTRYRSVAAALEVGQAPMTAGGSFTLVNFKEEFYFQYYEPGMTEAALNNILLFFTQETSAPGLGLQPRAAPRAARAQRGVRQPRHQRRQPAHRRPVRHVQRQPAALRLEAPRQEGDLRPLQRLPAAGRQAQVRAAAHQEPHQPGPGALRAASRLGGGLDPQARPEPHLQPAHAVRRRGLLADPRGRLLRQPRPAVPRAGGARHELLQPALAVDRPGAGHGPLERALPGARPAERGAALLRVLHQAHAGRLSAERAGASRHPLARDAVDPR